LKIRNNSIRGPTREWGIFNSNNSKKRVPFYNEGGAAERNYKFSCKKGSMGFSKISIYGYQFFRANCDKIAIVVPEHSSSYRKSGLMVTSKFTFKVPRGGGDQSTERGSLDFHALT
jgi:hypothetical protein